MNWLRVLWLRARTFLRRGVIEEELEAELRFHVDMETRNNIQLGMSQAEARRTALLQFGGVARFKDETRDARPSVWLEDLVRDARYALRSLRQSPVFALVAIVTLATGIGANTAIFSIVHQVLLQPLPYADADRLVTIWHRAREVGPDRLRVPAPDVQTYRDEADLFQDFAFMNNVADVTLDASAQSDHASIGMVTTNMFDLLGITPTVGRLFRPREGVVPASALEDDNFVVPTMPILLSHERWRSHFGNDSGVVGRAITINGDPARVIGVLPAGVEILLPPAVGMSGRADAWAPIRWELSAYRRAERLRDQDSDNTGAVIGRLRPGVSVEQAQAQMDGIVARQRRQILAYEDAGVQIDVHRMHDDVVGHVRPALRALFGAVVFVLLIACVNVSNLLLGRAEHRRREMALRAALGAGRGRLVRQLLVESGLLALAGGAIGLLFAVLGARYFIMLAPTSLPGSPGFALSPLVLVFTLVLASFAAIVFGLAPAVQLSRTHNAMALRDRGPTSGGKSRVARTLLVVELALSLVLLTGAGLMLRSFAQLQTVQPGFDPRGLLTFNFTFPDNRGGPGARARFMSRLQDRIRSLPGVSNVGLTGGLPLSGVVWTQPFGFEGQPVERWAQNEANFRVISSTYLQAMGTRLLAGRFFTREEDVLENDRVVIVDEQLARRIAPNGNPVGRVIGIPLDGAPVNAQVVGVVESVRYESLREDGRETIYVPYRQEASRSIGVAVRMTAEPSQLVVLIERELGELSGSAPVVAFNFQSMQEYVRESLAPTRFSLVLISVFSAIALIMTLVGVYGVFSYSISRRVHEIGIRMALGAGRRRVVREILTSGIRIVAVGVAVGWFVAFFAAKSLSTMVFGVGTTDLRTYLSVGLVLGLVSLAACYVPARRATRISPLSALRNE